VAHFHKEKAVNRLKFKLKQLAPSLLFLFTLTRFKSAPGQIYMGHIKFGAVTARTNKFELN